MKKTTLTLALLFAVSALIYAGPEAISGKEMKQVAQVPPPPCFNWTGFYAGAFGGYKFASVSTDLQPNHAYDSTFTDDFKSVDNLDTSGGEVGGLLGYNYQWRCWVFGIEADGGYLWLRDSFDSRTFTPADTSFTDKSIQQAFRTHYLFTFAPRIGYAFGKWLPYVTGGLAVGDFQYESRLHNVFGSPDGPYSSGDSVDETHAGWMLGGGLQYALTEHWSVRGQYQYIDLGSLDFQSPGSVGFTDFATHNSASLHEHNASFAIMFRF
jgi:outer membrane immunogenic protein